MKRHHPFCAPCATQVPLPSKQHLSATRAPPVPLPMQNDVYPRTRTRVARPQRLIAALIASLATLLAHAAPSVALVVNTTADAGDPTCATTCSLRQAIMNIAPGGTISFDPAILPGVIVLQQGALVVINKSMTISGPGAEQLAIDGNLTDRIFRIGNPGAGVPMAVTMSGLSLVNGRDVVADGSPGAAGTGSAGGAGSQARGGCIELADGSLRLSDVALRSCAAQGGAGGSGGSGAPNPSKAGGVGGVGGDGGQALGGAIFAWPQTALVLQRASIVDARAIGGAGGKGGNGGDGLFLGVGGSGGNGGGALGGAIFLAQVYQFGAINVTIAQSSAQGAKGGNGGSGDPDFSMSHGGDGGDGGYARGGLQFGDTSGFPPQVLDVAFSTLGEGVVTPGLHGSGGRAATAGGPGQDGSASAAAFAMVGSPAPMFVEHSVIFGPPSPPLCTGPVVGQFSVASDGSCPAFQVAAVDSWFKTLDPTRAMAGYEPRFGAPAIDATGCLTNVAFPDPFVSDMRGTARPQGAGCDLGAIEADYVFVGEFD